MAIKEVEISENKESLLNAVGYLSATVTGAVLALPINLEMKTAFAAIPAAVAGVIFAYWKAKVNKPVTVGP